MIRRRMGVALAGGLAGLASLASVQGTTADATPPPALAPAPLPSLGVPTGSSDDRWVTGTPLSELPRDDRGRIALSCPSTREPRAEPPCKPIPVPKVYESPEEVPKDGIHEALMPAP